MKKVLSVLMMIVMVLSLAACGGANDATAVKDAADAYLKGMQEKVSSTDALKANFENLGMTFEDADLAALAEVFAFTYTLGEAKVETDKATIPVTIEMVDLGVVTQSMLQEIGTIDQNDPKAVVDLMTKVAKDTEKVKTEIELKANKTDGKWVIEELDGLQNATPAPTQDDTMIPEDGATDGTIDGATDGTVDGATDGTATDGATDGAADGTATDGTATDGTATDGTATDGTATDGTATDGAAVQPAQ